MTDRVKRYKKKAIGEGFSIVELIIATTLFCIAFILVLGVLPSAFQATQITKTYILATQLATDKIEMVSRDGYFNYLDNDYKGSNDTNAQLYFPDKDNPGFVQLASFANGVEQKLNFEFYFNDFSTAKIASPDPWSGGTVDAMYNVTVTVSWQHAGVSRSIKLETIVPDL